MIQIEHVDVGGLLPALRGMRNPHNSWDKADSYIENAYVNGDAIIHEMMLGEADETLAMKLSEGGPVHAKYRRMIVVWADIVAPLYWWKEFDTYRMGVEKDSCSTMHTIHQKPFELDDFSHEQIVGEYNQSFLNDLIIALNQNRERFLATKCKEYWWNIIQLLPSSYNQRRTVMISYEALANMYKWRKNHKLDEWVDFCKWAEKLPCSEFFTGGVAGE